jgi:hypothetical protein
MTPAAVRQRLRWAYRKNVADQLALATGCMPGFVYAARPPTVPPSVPVFHFHSVEPERFGDQLAYLRDNGYTTLTADALADSLTRSAPPRERAVLLTFDDGRATTWTVAHPLLRRFGMHAVCFVIPGVIDEGDAPRPTLADAESSGDPDARERALAADRGPAPLCTWRELETMQHGGTLDVQSHTLHHHLVPVAPDILDFCRPEHASPAVLADSRLPVLRVDGVDRFDGAPPLGTPIFRGEPRMTDAPRFLDDEGVRRQLVGHVEAAGGEGFFTRPGWRRELERRWRELGGARRGAFESAADRQEDQERDLLEARRRIEARLGGKPVRHLCYPWFMGGRSAIAAARASGHVACYWGSWPSHHRRHRTDGAFCIPRLEDLYIFRLPGAGRWSLARVLAAKLAGMGPGGGAG